MIIGYDLGSAHIGRLLAADELPLTIVRGDTYEVPLEARDVRTSAGVAARAALVEELVSWVTPETSRAAIEYGRFYAPADANAAAILAMAAAHEIAGKIHELLVAALVARGVEVLTVARQTWAHILVPHHRGGVSTVEANEGVCLRCAPGVWDEIADQHQRDAAGAILGAWLVDLEPRGRRYKYRDRRKDKTQPRPAELDLSPEQRAEARRQRKRDQRHRRCILLAQERLSMRTAAGCVCVTGHNGGGRHKRGCPLAPAPMVHGDITAGLKHGSWLR